MQSVLSRTSRYWLARLGWSGLAALILCAAVPLLTFVSEPSLQQQLGALNDEIARKQTEVRTLKTTQEKIRTPEQELTDFRQRFPAAPTAAQWIQKIFVHASEQKVHLMQGEYTFQDQKDGGLAHYRMVFPVKATYPEIRKFVSVALAGIPTLSLEAIQFKREETGKPSIEARLTMLLYVESSK